MKKENPVMPDGPGMILPGRKIMYSSGLTKSTIYDIIGEGEWSKRNNLGFKLVEFDQFRRSNILGVFLVNEREFSF